MYQTVNTLTFIKKLKILDTQTYSNLKKELEYYLYFTPGEIGPRAMKDSNSD